MSASRFTGSIAARARNIFGNVRIICGQTDEQIVSSMHPPIHPKTLSRLIVTEQSISAPQLKATVNFSAERIGVSSDCILGYVRDPHDPAFDAVHQIAMAEIFRPTRKDLRCLRHRLARIEQSARTIRIVHRSMPSRLSTAALVRKAVLPTTAIWTRRLLSAWANEQRRRLQPLSQNLEIECCLLDTTLRHLKNATGPFAACNAQELSEQVAYLVDICIEEMGIRIPVVDAFDGDVLCALSLAWNRYESVTIYGDRACLRRDRRGNRYLYDVAARSDAARIVDQDAAHYSRIASRASDTIGRNAILNLCGEPEEPSD